MSTPSPRSMTLAYRIWSYATPKGWDCSARDIGEALGETTHRIIRTCQSHDWLTRLRRETRTGYSEQFGDPGLLNGYAERYERLRNVAMWIE